MTIKGSHIVKNLFATVFFLLHFSLIAQVSITSDAMPAPGDTIRYSNALSTEGIDYTLTGENYEWDFSSLTPLFQSVDTFASVSSVPFLYQLVFIPGFVANLAQKYPEIDTLGIPVADPYRFFKNTSSSYDDVGFAVTVADIPLPLKFDDPDVIYNFPVEYGNSNTSYSGVEFAIPDLGFISIDRQRINEVDGWGTLTTSMGTYNVIRMKSSVIEKDSIYIDSINFGQPINRNYVEYKWLSPDFVQPLLQVTEEGPLLTVAWVDSINNPPTAMPEGLAHNLSMQIVPNPVVNSGQIRIIRNVPGFVTLSIFNLAGVEVYGLYEGNLPAGSSNIQLDQVATRLQAGIYFVRLTSSGNMITKKLVVR